MKKITFPLLILTLLLFHAFVSYQILKSSVIVRESDERARIDYALSYYRLLFSNNTVSPGAKLAEVFSLEKLDNQRHPHLVEVVQAVAWKIIGYPNDQNLDAMILLSNTLFLAILLFSVYGIGSILHGRSAAFLAAFLVSFFPIVFGHQRVAMLDLPHASMVSLSVYLLLKTDYFRSCFYSILFGISFGLAQLTKETAFIFISAPLLYYAFRSFFSYRHKRFFLHVFLAFFFTGLVAGLVYLRPTNFHVFQRYIEIAHVRTYPDQLYYLKRASIFVGPLVGVLLVPLFLASTVQLKEKNKLLFLWFFVPLLIYSVSPSKTVRQLIPLLPALAVMLAGTLGGHRWFKKMRDSYVFLVISLAILQYACVNANIFYKESCQSPSTMDGGLLSVRKNSQLSAAKRLLSFFQKEVGTSKDARNVCFLFHYPGVYDFLRLSASLDELPLQIKCPLEGDEAAFRRDYGDLAQMDWSRVIAGMDYIIDKTGVTCGDPGPDERVISRGLQESFARHKNEFTRIAEFEFYGDRIRVYKKSSVSTRVD